MATQFVEGQPRLRNETGRRVETTGAGATVAAICAGASVVLTIIGLAGGLPHFLLSIATIVLGAAFLFEGGAVLSHHHQMAREAVPLDEQHVFDNMRGGLTTETIVGIGTIVLGILSLLGLATWPLEPIAAIAFGGGLVLGTSAMSRVMFATGRAGISESTRRLAHELSATYRSADVLVGCGAIVLGILAVLRLSPIPLTLIAVLGVSGALLLSGTGAGARMLGLLRHPEANRSPA